MTAITPQRLLQRLDDLGAHLATQPDTIALVGVGSAGIEFDRMDEHSDLDFIVLVEDASKSAYLASIDWLEAPCPVAYIFEQTVDGRKALYTDGIFVEYAVFTMAELSAFEHSGPRVIWQRSPELAFVPNPPKPSPYDHVEHHVNEVLTNLFVGLHRDLRGERLTATRFIQQHCIDRILSIVKLTDAGKHPDVFDVTRRAEQRCPDLPFGSMVTGYHGNAAAATAILDWLDARHALDPTMAAAVRELIAQVAARS